MTKTDALAIMKAPGDYRTGIWRGRVLQVKWGTGCSLSCNNCTAAVPQAKAHNMIWWMSPDQFRIALQSLKGFPGVIGAFGGLPTLHPNFEGMCKVFVEEIPDKDQRGLWANDLKGHGKLCRETFSAQHSNLNVHHIQKAYDEIARDWPEAIEARANFMKTGLTKPSMHGAMWAAIQDVIPDEGERWKLISKCFVNQTWSAQITVIRGELKAFFCEIAATRAEFADKLGESDNGLPVVPGWWDQPMSHFEQQVCHHCHRCGMAMNPKSVVDLGKSPQLHTQTNAAVFDFPNSRGQLVQSPDEVMSEVPVTGYLGDVCLRGKDRKPAGIA